VKTTEFHRLTFGQKQRQVALLDLYLREFTARRDQVEPPWTSSADLPASAGSDHALTYLEAATLVETQREGEALSYRLTDAGFAACRIFFAFE